MRFSCRSAIAMQAPKVYAIVGLTSINMGGSSTDSFWSSSGATGGNGGNIVSNGDITHLLLAFALLFDPEVRRHLRAIEAKYHALIRTTIEEQLRSGGSESSRLLPRWRAESIYLLRVMEPLCQGILCQLLSRPSSTFALTARNVASEK